MTIARRVGLFVAGAACGCVGHWLTTESTAPPTLSTAPTLVNVDDRLQSIDSALMEIRSRLSVVQDVQPAQVDRVTEQSSTLDPSALAATLEDLRTRLESLRVDVSQSLRVLRSGLPQLPKNPAAVEAAFIAEESEPGAIRRRHFCWTQAQVYLAYGLPDVTGNSGGNPFWGYYIDNDNGLFVIFSSGVVDMVTRLPPATGLLPRPKPPEGE